MLLYGALRYVRERSEATRPNAVSANILYPDLFHPIIHLRPQLLLSHQVATLISHPATRTTAILPQYPGEIDAGSQRPDFPPLLHQDRVLSRIPPNHIAGDHPYPREHCQHGHQSVVEAPLVGFSVVRHEADRVSRVADEFL